MVKCGLLCAGLLILNVTCVGSSTQELLDTTGLPIDRTPPKIIAPAYAAKITGNSATLSWESRFAATEYTVEIARDAAFTQPMAVSPYKSVTSYLNVTFADAYSYHWRIRANTTPSGQFSDVGLVHVLAGAVRVYCASGNASCSNTDKIGNKSSPYEQIGHALTIAAGLDLPVHVASRGGTAVYNGTINLVEGVSLLGGYNGTTWARDVSANVTELYSEGKFTVYGGSSAATASPYRLDGFTIRLKVVTNVGDPLDRQAIRLDFSASPLTISNNSIYLDVSTGSCFTTGRAVYLTDSTAIIESNSIFDSDLFTCSGGLGGEVLIDMSNSSPVIRNNRLVSRKSSTQLRTSLMMNAKASPVIYGNKFENARYPMYLTGYSRPVIFDNTVQLAALAGSDTRSIEFGSNNPAAVIGGNRFFSGTSTNVTTWNIGSSPGSSFKIFNNTIQVAATTTSVAATAKEGMFFLNNILFTTSGTTRRCFSEGVAGYDPGMFLNNNLFDCPDALYLDEVGTSRLTIGNVNDHNLTTQAGISTSIGNVSFPDTSNQLFVDINGADNNYATIADNNWALRTGATGVINGGVSCPAGFATATHDWNDSFGSPESNQAGCDARYFAQKTTYAAGVCRTTYLYPAMEIPDDKIGNDNGLCEAGETCLINPNMGAYAGHGSLVNAGCDVSGLIANVTLLQYAQNGY